MRKIVVLIVTMAAALLMLPVVGHANATANLFLNGQPLLSSVPPAIVNSTTMVPFRIVAEQLGASVTWEHQTKQVVVVQASKKIRLVVNDKTAIVNDETYTLETAPLIMNGRTMIPLRFVGEQLGLQVQWEPKTKSVYMEQKQADKPEEPPHETTPDQGQPEQPVGNDPDDYSGPVAVKPSESGKPDVIDEVRLVELIHFSMDQILIQGDGPIAVKASTLDNPDRLIFDLENSQFAPIFNGMSGTETGRVTNGEIPLIGHPFIQKIRYSLFRDQPAVIRIVADLSQKTGYQIEQLPEQNQIRITILSPEEWNSSNEPEQHLFKVVIDAGHGGSDPGAISVNNRNEKDLNLAVALKVHGLLENEPMIESHLTRAEDQFIDLNERVHFANQLGADLFVSIHGNKFTASVRGTETYYSRQDSKSFAEVIHRHVLAATGFPDRNVKQADFRVIKSTTMPAALIELGFLSNPEEEAEMYREEFQNRVAQAIVAALKEYLRLN